MEIFGKILLLGDIHGNFPHAFNLCNANTDTTIIQVGDFGIGFGKDNPERINKYTNLRWIGGNHENMTRCKLYDGYLGRFGWFQWRPDINSPVTLKVFFCSGAWSIDWQHRTPGKDWWADEELSAEEMDQARKLYLDVKPDIVISHDCPSLLWPDLIKQIQMLFGPNKIPTRTGTFLDDLFREHRPRQWFFGHYHGSAVIEKDGCVFHCLNIGETLLLDGLR